MLMLTLIVSNLEARLPKATFNEDTGRTTCSRKGKQPLDLKSMPVAMSFGVFDS